MKNEFDNFVKRGSWAKFSRTRSKEEGKKIIGVKHVYKLKNPTSGPPWGPVAAGDAPLTSSFIKRCVVLYLMHLEPKYGLYSFEAVMASNLRPTRSSWIK